MVEVVILVAHSRNKVSEEENLSDEGIVVNALITFPNALCFFGVSPLFQWLIYSSSLIFLPLPAAFLQ